MKRAAGGDRTETKTCETIPSYPSGNVILFWTGSDSFKLFFRGFPLHFEPRPVVSLCDSRAQRRMLTGYPCQRQAQNMEQLSPPSGTRIQRTGVLFFVSSCSTQVADKRFRSVPSNIDGSGGFQDGGQFSSK